MSLPGFNAETSLHPTSRHYRTSGRFGQADGIYPALSISELVKSSLGLTDLVVKSFHDFGDLFSIDRPFPTAVSCESNNNRRNTIMDATGVVSVIGTAPNLYVVANSPQGRVVLSGPYATVVEANKAISTPF